MRRPGSRATHIASRVRLEMITESRFSAVSARRWIEADSKAFRSVMHHIREVDSNNHTVLMMQVENEVGILGDTRDHSGPANRAFESAVPAELTRYLVANRESLYPELRDLWEQNGAKISGTWEQIFGGSPGADEIFMAWNYARYVHTVAAWESRLRPSDVREYLACWRRCHAWRLPQWWSAASRSRHLESCRSLLRTPAFSFSERRVPAKS
jgi:hypothetical protein